MGLCDTYYEWRKSLEDLEDSFNHMNNRVKHIQDDEARGEMKGGMTFLNKSFKDCKQNCEHLDRIINKMF